MSGTKSKKQHSIDISMQYRCIDAISTYRYCAEINQRMTVFLAINVNDRWF